jgi:hypothetical protein
VVVNLDRSTLARNIEAAKCYFFYLAGEMRATVLGRRRLGAVCRAMRAILARRGEENFNSEEITEVTSKWFLGIPLLRVTTHARHIQERVGLIAAKGLVLSTPVVTARAVARESPAQAAR